MRGMLYRYIIVMKDVSINIKNKCNIRVNAVSIMRSLGGQPVHLRILVKSDPFLPVYRIACYCRIYGL